MTANPLDQAVGMAVFVAAFCFLIYGIRELIRAAISPEFKRDLAELREQRKRRRAARRQK